MDSQSTTSTSPATQQTATQPTSMDSAPPQPVSIPQNTSRPKRGNPGKFRGEHLEFLQARIDGYLSLNARNEKSQWIANLTHEWFQKFPWHTHSEPAEFAVLHGDDGNLTSEQRAELEERRDEVLSQTVKAGQKEIINWVHRQIQKPVQQENAKAFVAISKQMSKAAGGAPRRKPNYKYFMSHPDYKPVFQAYYEEKTEGNPPPKAQRMAVQCQLAKELYATQTDEVKLKIALENTESHSERFTAFKKLLSGHGFSLDTIDQLTDADKALCRASLTQFMQPLLDAIRAHTGLFLTLFVGAPPENGSEQFTLATISSGNVNGQKFQQWKSGKPLQNAIREFILFLNEALPNVQNIDL
ncbi:hypothetical protein F5880DRAFT_1512706 [Lentinula raphanica]|nr:hypothetical protein F5880DRAFT_1512706 [Lentinula raphanica]